MNTDKWGEVINGEETYRTIVEELRDKNSVIIGWTDEEYTHFDLYFSLENTNKYGSLQRGIKGTDLFVGIVDHSFYGFKTDSTKHESYISEKLRLGENTTSRKVAELINGIILELNGGNNG